MSSQRMKLPIFVKRLIFGGSSRLSATEVSILDAVRAQLSPDEASTISVQIGEIETVQKHLDRIIAISCRRGTSAPLLADGEYCLAKLRLKEEEGKTSSVSVWCYGGRLRSIEYSRRPKREFSILACEIRPKKATSAATVIDRLEHPDEKKG